MLPELILLLVLILTNAFFAASEIALISLNDSKVRLMAEEGNRKAKLLKVLLEEPSRFLATIQIGITLAGFLASAVAAESFSGALVNWLTMIGVSLSDTWLRPLSVIFITIILSYFTLVLGELVPKRIAMQKAEPIAMFSVAPLHYLLVITKPFVRLLTYSTNAIVKLFGIDPHQKVESATEEEIRLLVDVGEEKGTIDISEKQMINNIFEFNNKTVAEIMTHRTDIAALPIDADLHTVLAFADQEKYSRIPVYEDVIDNIIGVMHTKYLIPYVKQHEPEKEFSLQHIIRKPYFVPQFKKNDEVFRELQQNKIHFAIVLDEFGGTAGIVTLEDLVEEIVGNIFDEDDEVEQDIVKIDNQTFLVNGTTSLEDVQEYFKVDFPTEEFETLSGFVISRLGRIPGHDEHPTLQYQGMEFTVKESDAKVVSKVKIKCA